MHCTETNNPKKHNTHQIPKFQISDLMHLKDEQNLDIYSTLSSRMFWVQIQNLHIIVLKHNFIIG